MKMIKLALGFLCAVLVACDDGKKQPDFEDDEPDSGPHFCNPLTQTGCNAGEKCTWIEDQESPPIGHVGCAPEAVAAKPIGTACTPPPAGPMGYDDCAKGAVCLAGVCKQICDVMNGAPTCDQNHACTRYADFFEVAGSAVAGVCDPACDPLTQELKVGTNKAACGSPTPNMPTAGCYGYDSYICAPVGPTTLTLLDRDPPRTNSAGNPFLNGCAPGFMPLFFEMTGSTKTLCTGLCAALEIDNTQANNNQGNPNALAKMPTDAAPTAGHGVCSAAYKGSSSSSSCRFIYPYLENDQGVLPLAFEQSTHLDTLGVCFEYTQFNYDHDMNTMTPNMPYPSCATLPKRSAATPGNSDDAADWGCQKRSSSQLTSDGNAGFHSALDQLRVPKNAPLELERHRFEE